MNRTVLKYPGAKWRIADWIIAKMPKHHSYLEPYFGSGAVFFKKKPSDIETVNDLDNRIYTLFKIVREDPESLARVINDTPFSRNEYDNAFEPTDDVLESARRFLVQCWQGHGFRTNGYKVGWKNDVQGRERAYALSNWNRLPSWIIEIKDRLKSVQIENRPAVELIKRFNYPNVLIYTDPPYLLGTRTGKQYKYEMTEQDHIELLETLLQHSGSVIISGYQNDLYDTMLSKWHKATIQSNAEYYNGTNRTEVVWMNYEPSEKQNSLII